MVPRPSPLPQRAHPQPAPADFDVELDIDIEEHDGQEQMELTGRIKVTGGGNITAELHGANLTAGATKGPVSGERPSGLDQGAPQPAYASSTSGVRPARQGELRDNLPGLIAAFYDSKETGELHCQRDR